MGSTGKRKDRRDVKKQPAEPRMRMPASFESAWGVRERPVKGPKRGLSLEQIVETAVDVAASDGIDAVSMSRIATALDASTMALYRYVSAKEELLALMVDSVFDAAPDTRAKGEPWRDALSRWARAHHEVLLRHPWVVRVPTSGPPITPNLVLWFERGLAALEGTTLSEAEKISVLMLLNGFVRNEATLTADLGLLSGADAGAGAGAGAGSARRAAKVAQDAQEMAASYGRMLSRLVDPQRFPAISALLAAGVFEQPGGGDDRHADFIFGLDRILDGIAVFMRKHAR